MLTGLGRWAKSRRFLFFQAMPEEQLNTPAVEATQQEDVEEISAEDLEGVAGGVMRGAVTEPGCTLVS